MEVLPPVNGAATQGPGRPQAPQRNDFAAFLDLPLVNIRTAPRNARRRRFVPQDAPWRRERRADFVVHVPPDRQTKGDAHSASRAVNASTVSSTTTHRAMVRASPRSPRGMRLVVRVNVRSMFTGP